MRCALPNTLPWPLSGVGRVVRAAIRHATACIVVGLVLGGGLAAGVQACYVLLAGNFHTVLPGKLYRCGQPSGPNLEKLIQQHHLKTVVNLRGPNGEDGWYLDECRACANQKALHVDISLHGSFPPIREELLRLLDLLEHGEYPMLVHCESGSDRAGLASAFAVLLQPNGDLTAARRALSIRFGHSALGRAGCHDRLLDQYGAWLAATSRTHQTAHLREWIAREYQPERIR